MSPAGVSPNADTPAMHSRRRGVGRTLSPLEAGYLVLAVAGLIGTWYFNLHSSDVQGGYVRGWFANAASSSAAVDLIVVFVTSAVFMIVEGRRLRMRAPWLYPLLAVPTAVAFTFPVFLLARSRAMRHTTIVDPDSATSPRA